MKHGEIKHADVMLNVTDVQIQQLYDRNNTIYLQTFLNDRIKTRRHLRRHPRALQYNVNAFETTHQRSAQFQKLI